MVPFQESISAKTTFTFNSSTSLLPSFDILDDLHDTSASATNTLDNITLNKPMAQI